MGCRQGLEMYFVGLWVQGHHHTRHAAIQGHAVLGTNEGGAGLTLPCHNNPVVMEGLNQAVMVGDLSSFLPDDIFHFGHFRQAIGIDFQILFHVHQVAFENIGDGDLTLTFGFQSLDNDQHLLAKLLQVSRLILQFKMFLAF